MLHSQCMANYIEQCGLQDNNHGPPNRQMLSWHKYPPTAVYCFSSRGCATVYVHNCQYRCSTGKIFQRTYITKDLLLH